MSWLAQFGYFVASWILNKICGVIVTALKAAKRTHDTEEASKESVKPLQDAKTAQEIDDAADSALDHF